MAGAPRKRRGRGNRSLGWLGERIASLYLRARGLRLVARNVRWGRDEIDLVFLDGRTLVFVEVKARTRVASRLELDPFAAIDRRKRRALRRAARAYLARSRLRADEYRCARVDGVAIEFARIGPLRVPVRLFWERALDTLD